MNKHGLKSRKVAVVGVVFLLLTFVWSRPVLALDPKKAITQYVYDVWQIENGLPQNSVNSILQTHDGYLWLATYEGLVRYDGVRFTVFDTSNTENFSHNNITVLFEDQTGCLWIGMLGGGLMQHKNGRFTTYMMKDGLTNNTVWSIQADQQGNIWIGTDGGGLNQFREGKFTAWTMKEGLAGNTVKTLWEARDGSLWIGTEGGLSLLRDGRLTAYTTQQGLSNNLIQAVYEDRAGNLWIGTGGGGLNRFKDGRFTIYTMKEGLSHNSVSCILEDRDGSLWIGTQGGGLNRFKDGQFVSYTKKEGLADDIINSIYEDREGSLWFGTYTGGLCRFRDGKFIALAQEEGLATEAVRTVYEDRHGNLWIGMEIGGLARYRDGKFTLYTTKDGLINNAVKSIWEDREGGLWIGTLGGVSRLKDGKFTNYTTNNGLSNNAVRVVYEDREGNVWIGTTGGGLCQLSHGRFKTYTAKDGLSHDSVRTIYEDRAGNLWIGTWGGGLNRFKDGQFTSYTTADGLCHNMVTSIYEDLEGNLWLSTNGGGINLFRNGRFVTYAVKDGLFQNIVHQILDDGTGNFWMSTNRGIFSVRKQGLEDFAQGRIASITSISYDTADGMKSRECSGGGPGGWRARDGKLWFATIKGAVAIDPPNLGLNELAPLVLIEQVVIDKRRIDPKAEAQLPPGNGELEFYYAALSFLAPEKVKFKYQLEGFNKDWIEAGTRRVAYYTNIPPGKYRFRVIACNNDGVWNETGAAFRFYLRPHFYQSYWFYALCALAVALVGAGFYRLRIQRLKAREKELVLLVNERTKELQWHSTELQRSNRELQQFAYVASHDLQEPLRMISSYVSLLARRYTDNLDSDANEFINFALDGASRMQVLINDLLAYSRVGTHGKPFAPTDCEEVFRQAVANLQVAIQENEAVVTHDPLPEVMADNTQMIQLLQNLIGNAIKYRSADRHPVVHVGVRRSNGEWLISVSDNGIGIESEHFDRIFIIFQRLHSREEYSGTGIGLAVCKKIVERHGGRIWLESEPGKGSTFYFTLPRTET